MSTLRACDRWLLVATRHMQSLHVAAPQVVARLAFGAQWSPRSSEWWRSYAQTNCGFPVGKYSYGFEQFCCRRENNIGAIGAFTSIASPVFATGVNHPLNLATTHPFVYLRNRGFVDSDRPELQAGAKNQPVIIGNDCWIGQHSILLPSVRIGDGAVVAAGAVVTKDVAPYTIVGGSPARVIRSRFPQPVVDELLVTQWWTWDDETIRARIAEFEDVEAFVHIRGSLPGR